MSTSSHSDSSPVFKPSLPAAFAHATTSAVPAGLSNALIAPSDSQFLFTKSINIPVSNKRYQRPNLGIADSSDETGMQTGMQSNSNAARTVATTYQRPDLGVALSQASQTAASQSLPAFQATTSKTVISPQRVPASQAATMSATAQTQATTAQTTIASQTGAASQ